MSGTEIVLGIATICAMILPLAVRGGQDTAAFSGGCFWCMQPPFEQIPGVMKVWAGYTGGNTVNPTYEEVSSGSTGHYESIQVIYDPSKVSYETLLEVFWRNIDPTDAGGQFVDRGKQYRTAIFYYSEEQRKAAETSKQALASSGKFKRTIITPILKAGPFYKAEDYHQDFYLKSPGRYNSYRSGAGRDEFVKNLWGDDPIKLLQPKAEEQGFKKPSQDELKKKLTPLEREVTQQNGTEPPFHNEFWNNHREGIYVDIVSGEPLFSSKDKFDSGTGWPSFTKPLVSTNVIEESDNSLSMERTEVRSRMANSHLGHVFNDGPAPTGLRYCINSAALRFIPKEDLAKEGYGKYESLFK